MTAAVATRVTMPDPTSVTRRLPWNGEKSNEKAPPASLMVAIVGAGGVGATIGAGAGVGVVGAELPQAEAIRAITSTDAPCFPHSCVTGFRSVSVECGAFTAVRQRYFGG